MGTKMWQVHKGRQQREGGNKRWVFSFPKEQTRHERGRKLQGDNGKFRASLHPAIRGESIQTYKFLIRTLYQILLIFDILFNIL